MLSWLSAKIRTKWIIGCTKWIFEYFSYLALVEYRTKWIRIQRGPGVVTFTEWIKMAVLFLIFMDQICPKWIKLDQIGFPHQSRNVTIKSCHISRKDKNSCFVSDFFWIKSVQNGSNLIKIIQIGFSRQSKNVTIKSCHIYRKDKYGCFVLDLLHQICP